MIKSIYLCIYVIIKFDVCYYKMNVIDCLYKYLLNINESYWIVIKIKYYNFKGRKGCYMYKNKMLCININNL